VSGKDANVHAAQQALLHRVRCNSAARRGRYDQQHDWGRPLPEDGSR
jgi:hypothetical protein